MSNWIGVAEAATKMGVSTVTVRRLVKRDAIPHRRVGSRIKFVPEELDAYDGRDPDTTPPAPVGGGRRSRIAAMNPYAAV